MDLLLIALPVLCPTVTPTIDSVLKRDFISDSSALSRGVIVGLVFSVCWGINGCGYAPIFNCRTLSLNLICTEDRIQTRVCCR